MAMSWNIFFAFCVLVAVLYGFILQRNKIILTLVNVYIGLAVVGVVGPGFNNLLQKLGETMLNGQLAGKFFSLFLTQTFLFVAIIIILTVRSEHAKALTDVKVSHPMILSFLYSILFALIVCTTIVSFLTPELQANIVSQSSVLGWFLSYKSWWIVLPVVMMIISSYFIVPTEES
jgi:hypothetical protein